MWQKLGHLECHNVGFDNLFPALICSYSVVNYNLYTIITYIIKWILTWNTSHEKTHNPLQKICPWLCLNHMASKRAINMIQMYTLLNFVMENCSIMLFIHKLRLIIFDLMWPCGAHVAIFVLFYTLNTFLPTIACKQIPQDLFFFFWKGFSYLKKAMLFALFFCWVEFLI